MVSQIKVVITSFFILLSCCSASSKWKLPVRGVNLGGWLVIDGRITPSLFDGISNKELLDGTRFRLKSVKYGTYLTAEGGGGGKIVADRVIASDWETFRYWRDTEGACFFRAFSNQFVGLEKDGTATLVAVESNPQLGENFWVHRKPDDPTRIRIEAANSAFFQVTDEKKVVANYPSETAWGNDDPSVFLIEYNGQLKGEFQLVHGYMNDYDSSISSKVLNEHWRTFITEDDFKFIAQNGMNTVRIPIGWWVAIFPTPWPFIGGSLQYLDMAFTWAKKYGLKIIIVLQSAPGSQNGWDSGSIDGTQEWGLTNQTIQQTVAVIDYLAAKYAKRSNLLAIELLDEPLSPGVSLATLTKYYKAGYEAVRKYSSSIFVILSNRIGSTNYTELFPLTTNLVKPVIDVHFYNLYGDFFDNFTVDQNIKYVRLNRSAELSALTKRDGPLIFVGEWVNEWRVKNSTKREYQRFGVNQLKVYGEATFGWAYWSLKSAELHWSLEWMIRKGFMRLFFFFFFFLYIYIFFFFH